MPGAGGQGCAARPLFLWASDPGVLRRHLIAAQADPAAVHRAELRELLACGRVIPNIGAAFELSEAASALRHVADGRAIGKVVLKVGEIA